jgi:hypothetical protein
MTRPAGSKNKELTLTQLRIQNQELRTENELLKLKVDSVERANVVLAAQNEKLWQDKQELNRLFSLTKV